MKRLISTLLALSFALSLVSCAENTPVETLEEEKTTVESTASEEKNQKETEEKKTEESVDMTVEKPLTREALEAIPIANSSMSTDELRQICVDFLKLSVSFQFKPNQNYTFKKKPDWAPDVLKKGSVYGGIPYVSVGTGNLYRAMDFYDSETGVLDVSTFLDNKMLGNACSGAACWAWGRVINSAKPRYTANLTHANGYLKVGPYEYDLTKTVLNDEYGHTDIKKANGEQVMFQSYAQTLPADGIVNPDHVRMVSGKPHVEYNEDGTINGDKSYLPCSEQTSANTSDPFRRELSDGTVYYNAGVESHNYTFAKLYKSSYLPFTFAEFHGQDPVEPATVELSHKGATATKDQIAASTLSANYIAGDVYFTITSADGTVVREYVKRVTSFQKYNWEMGAIAPASLLQEYADGNHTVQIHCQLGTGQKLLAYSGTLVS